MVTFLKTDLLFLYVICAFSSVLRSLWLSYTHTIFEVYMLPPDLIIHIDQTLKLLLLLLNLLSLSFYEILHRVYTLLLLLQLNQLVLHPLLTHSPSVVLSVGAVILRDILLTVYLMLWLLNKFYIFKPL